MAKVLLIGSGGREHALGWKLAQSTHVEAVFFAPGNGGTDKSDEAEATSCALQNIPFDATQPNQWPALCEWIVAQEVSLTVVGPEAPLAAGFADHLQANGLAVFGPSQACAQLEADKFFSFELMDACGIPQAASVCCRTPEEAHDAIDRLCNAHGVVLKARGLTGGKGVLVCEDAAEAHEALARHRAQYGPDLLVAERLSGPEFSLFAIADGDAVWPFTPAFQDYKARDDGDQGPNTGGMGAYGPVPFVSAEDAHLLCQRVMTPIVQAFKERGTPYLGFLYAGMLMTPQGPKVLEYNVRFGDPECQVAMTLLESDLYNILHKAHHKTLQASDFSFRPGAACCVVLASKGYPGPIQKDLPISGLPLTHTDPNVHIFHAGTSHNDETLRTSGGRVLGVTAYAPSGLPEARQRAYHTAQSIHIPGLFHLRSDIGHD